MNAWLGLGLDLVLILLVAVGIVQAGRLIRQLANLRESRADMERFVRDFNSTVMRAETGIKALRQAARDSGDDLERLVDKAHMVRDELHFIVESADQIAGRLSIGAGNAIRPAIPEKTSPPPAAPPAPAEMAAPFTARSAPASSSGSAPSRAEKELMQALQKTGLR